MATFYFPNNATTATGTDAADSMIATTNNVGITIDARGGDDLVAGGSAADRLLGGDGNDRVSGGLGNDRVEGGSGDDLLFGNDGTDILIGGTGADRLDGGWGSDWLSGGGGADTFVFNYGQQTNGAADFALDFEVGVDSIDFNYQTISGIHATQMGAMTQYAIVTDSGLYGEGLVIVNTFGELSAADFTSGDLSAIDFDLIA